MSVRSLDPVAGALAERAAEEAELEHDQYGRGAADGRAAADDGLVLTGARGGAGAGGVVAVPPQRPVRLGLPCGVGEFAEVVGDEGEDLPCGQTLRHRPAPAS
jgi:hypothetical protein